MTLEIKLDENVKPNYTITQEEVEAILLRNFPHKKIQIKEILFNNEKRFFLFRLKIGNLVKVSENYKITFDALESYRAAMKKEQEEKANAEQPKS